MLGRSILLSNEPRGRYHEGPISGTPKPGVCMQIKAATAKVNGEFTWEVFNQAADGTRALVAVLLEDKLQGRTYDTAYVSGDRCFIYCPIPGEEFNMRMLDVAGTGDDKAIGDRLMIDDTTGKLVAVGGSEEAAPFICLEASVDPDAEELLHCMFTGY